jgi:DNA polymerase III epsilon subunit-like protein
MAASLEDSFSSLGVADSSSKVTPKPRVLCVDVEALASGQSHNDRAPCWVALVDSTAPGAQPVLDLKMKPEHIVDYLTFLSGVDEASLKGAVSVEEGLSIVRAALDPEVTLVGWNVQSDIGWLGLEKGVHYKTAVDCIDWFSHDQRRGDTVFTRRYGLAHVAHLLLDYNVRSDDGSHSPIKDAVATLKLYEQYVAHVGPTIQQPKPTLKSAIKKIRNTPILKEHMGTSEPTALGVCMSGYNPKKCICNAPMKGGD